jgi:hypothetical protein
LCDAAETDEEQVERHHEVAGAPPEPVQTPPISTSRS